MCDTSHLLIVLIHHKHVTTDIKFKYIKYSLN